MIPVGRFKLSELRQVFGGRNSNMDVRSYLLDYLPGGSLTGDIDFSADQESSLTKSASQLQGKSKMTVISPTFSTVAGVTTVSWQGSGYTKALVTWPGGSALVNYGTFSCDISGLPAGSTSAINVTPVSATSRYGTIAATLNVDTPAAVVGRALLPGTYNVALLPSELTPRLANGAKVDILGTYSQTNASYQPTYYSSGGYNSAPFLRFTSASPTQLTKTGLLRVDFGLTLIMLMKPNEPGTVNNNAWARFASIFSNGGISSVATTIPGYFEVFRASTSDSIGFSIYTAATTTDTERLVTLTSTSTDLVTGQWGLYVFRYRNDTMVADIKKLHLPSVITGISSINELTTVATNTGTAPFQAAFNTNVNALFSYKDVGTQAPAMDMGGCFLFDRVVSDADVVTTANFMLSGSDFAGPVFDLMSSSATSASKGLYALRLLLTAYTGPILTVRRGSDSVSSDFYSDSAGGFGTGAGGAGTSLPSWLGGSTGYVSKWWDQSGTGNHAVQTVAASQPIYVAGTPSKLDFNTARFLALPNGTVPFGNNNYSMVARHGTVTAVDGSSAPILCSGGYTTRTHNGLAVAFQLVNSTSYMSYNNAWWSRDIATNNKLPSNNCVVSVTYDKAIVSRTIYENASSVMSATNAGALRQSTSVNNAIGRDYRSVQAGSDRYLNGELMSLCVFSAPLNDDDRRIVERM